MERKKILVILGTRPEGIKLGPLINELRSRDFLDVLVLNTGQHKEMLDPIFEIFDIVPDFNLQLMKSNAGLSDLVIKTFAGISRVIEVEKPDVIIVQGDTIATFAGALASFHSNTYLVHVEAGLRSLNIKSPYPEEFYRRSVSLVTDLNFAPTKAAKNNLIEEKIPNDKIFVVGNTGIDSLSRIIKQDFSNPLLTWASDKKMIILSTHRRENLDGPMQEIFSSIRSLLRTRNDIKIIYPIHKNPLIRNLADKYLKNSDRIKIVEPLDVITFQNLLSRAYMVMTDSGGIQEEVTHLGIPTLVLRNTTERPEGVESGPLKVIGTNEDTIMIEANKLLDDLNYYKSVSVRSSVYGDGKASVKIVDVLVDKLC